MCMSVHHSWVSWHYFVLIQLCIYPTHGLIIPKRLSLSVSSIVHVFLSRNSTQCLQLSMPMSLLLSLFLNQDIQKIHTLENRNKIVMESCSLIVLACTKNRFSFVSFYYLHLNIDSFGLSGN